MAYMIRLGLWGEGTYFSDFGCFLGSVFSLIFLFSSHFILMSAKGKCFDTCLRILAQIMRHIIVYFDVAFGPHPVIV
jgi:hypothetical protein